MSDDDAEVLLPLAALSEEAPSSAPLATRVRFWLREQVARGGTSGELRLRWRKTEDGIEVRFGAPVAAERVTVGELLVVDDDALLAQSLVRLFRPYGPVTIASTLEEALAAWRQPARWIGLVVDVELPDGDGLDFVAAVRETDSRIPILVQTGGIEPERTNRAQMLDAEFLFKPVPTENLRAFAERACARFRVDDHSVAAVIARMGHVHHLTPREVEVFGLVVHSDGSPRAAAAEALGLSPNTVKVHIGSILRKTNTPKLADLVHAVLWEAWVSTRPRP